MGGKLKFLLCIIFLIFAFSLKSEEDHLLPEMGFFGDKANREYMNVIYKLMHKQFVGDICLARMIAIPSFVPEWGINVSRHTPMIDDGLFEPTVDKSKPPEYYVTLVLLKSNYYHYHKTNFSSYRTKIDKNTANAINKLWVKMLKTVRYGKRERFPLDCTAYHFYCQNNNSRNFVYSGQTDSPAYNSIPGKFVNVTILLAELAKTSDIAEKTKLLKKINEKIADLMKKKTE